MKTQDKVKRKKAQKHTDDEDISAEEASKIDRGSITDGELTEDEEIYRENILDHYRNPRNTGKVTNPTITHQEHNPLCGDTIEITLKLDANDRVKEVKYIGKGCAISQASMSILSDAIKGKTLDEINKITQEDIKKMLGIPIGVVRMKCAMLSVRTLHKGIESYKTSRKISA